VSCSLSFLCLFPCVLCLLGQDVHGNRLSRSEGLGVASFDMFKDGIFSSDAALPHRVNSHGLKQLQLSKLVKGFQIDEAENPMVGLEGRFKLLRRLAKALDSHPEFFGGSNFHTPRKRCRHHVAVTLQ
jgi:hypothetical protein